MVRRISTLLLLALSWGCSESVLDQCKSDSIEDIEWLKKEIDNRGYSSPNASYEVIVYKTSYQLGPVFIITICCPFCLTTPPEVRNCSGNTIGQLGVDIDYKILDKAKVIWRTHNGICED